MTDDAKTLTWLMGIFAVGGPKYEEAYYIFQELIDKFGETVPLLNGIAVACMHQGNYDQASGYLVSALGKNGSNPDTLVNMIVCAQVYTLICVASIRCPLAGCSITITILMHVCVLSIS